MKTKIMRRTLLMSVLALILCVSMLISTTFAWFTDSVTSAKNTIVAGNLDIELYYQAEGQTSWTKVTADTSIFMENALWEPGHTEVVKLKVVNEGTLALKYSLGVNIVSETGSVNKSDESFLLSDYIKFGIVDGAKDYTRDEAVAAVEGSATALNIAYKSDVKELMPKAEDNIVEDIYTDIVTMVVYMPTTVGNEANHMTGAAQPSINLGIDLLAAQLTHEEDSFDDQYDSDAKIPAVDSVTIEMDSVSLGKGTTTTLNAVVSPEYAVNKTLTWTSSNEAVATVDENGVVTGAGLGTATITATAGEFSDSCEVTVYKDYVRKLNIAHTQTSYISTSTGADFLPVVAAMPEITGYSIYDGDTRIANKVVFRYTRVEKQTISENTYKVLVELEIKDENGNDLELKPGMPSTINGKEYLNLFLNLIELPAGYSVSGVRVNGSALTETTSGNPATGEYWIGYDGNDVYLQTMETGLIEVIVTKGN